jgi:hypothetical protein
MKHLTDLFFTSVSSFLHLFFSPISFLYFYNTSFLRHKSDIRAICCSINKRMERRHYASFPVPVTAPAPDIPTDAPLALHTGSAGSNGSTGGSLPSFVSALSSRLVHPAASASGTATGTAADPFGPLLLSVQTSFEPSLKTVYRNTGDQISNNTHRQSDILPSCPTLTPVTATTDHTVPALSREALLRSPRPILRTLKDVVSFYYRRCQFDSPGDNEDIECGKVLEGRAAPRSTMASQHHTQPPSNHSYSPFISDIHIRVCVKNDVNCVELRLCSYHPPF